MGGSVSSKKSSLHESNVLSSSTSSSNSGNSTIEPEVLIVKSTEKNVWTSWSNIPNPSSSDYITISVVGSTEADYVTYAYNADAKCAASIKIDCDGYLKAGTNYEIRYVAASGNIITTSNTSFNINNITSHQSSGTGEDASPAFASTPAPTIKAVATVPTLPKGIIKFEGTKPLAPEIINWVEQMPDTQMKLDQATAYMTGVVEAQINAYSKAACAGDENSSMELVKVLKQKADITLYTEELKKQLNDSNNTESKTSFAQYYDSQDTATIAVVRSILLYEKNSPYDDITMKRLNDVVSCCVSDLAPSRLRKILLDDEESIKKQIDKNSTDAAKSIQKIRNELGGPCGYIALALKMCICYMNWNVYQARTKGTFLQIIEEALEAPEQNESLEWCEMNYAVLVLCGHLASYHPATSKSKLFQQLIACVKKHMNKVTSELQLEEDLMKTSGEFAMLGALSIANNNKENQRLRQNDDLILGKHPMYVKYKAEYNKLETKIYNFPYYLNLPKEMFSEYPDDLKQMIDYLSKGCYKALQYNASMDKAENLCTINAQPYIFFLIHCARQINTSFHTKIKNLVGESRYGTKDPSKASVKCFARMKEKQEEKYTSKNFGSCSASVMSDVVRCLVTCKDPNDLKDVFDLIIQNFNVIRVKNGFAERAVPFGFRQILMNVIHECPDSKLTMLCEIQLNLATYVCVKHRIHRLYSVVRCEDNCGMQPDLYVQLIKKAFPF